MPKQIVVENLLISYNETAGDSGTILLFLHGWRSSKEIWSNVESRIKDKGLRIIALDLPGFGGSQVPLQSMTVGDYAEVVAGFIRKLELMNVIIVGHSFGGRVGIKLASIYPALISKLVLADSAGFVTEQTKKRVMELTAKLVKPFFLPKFMQGLRRKIYGLIGADDYVATPWLTETYIKIKDEDLTKDIRKIGIPTLIIYGSDDKDTPAAFGKKMQSLIPNSKFLILKGAGHFSFLDKPEEFVSALEKFIV